MIIAIFRNGKEVTYTKAIFHLLMNDSEVLHILDAETGELYK